MTLHSATALSEEARARVGDILNHALADEFALSMAARDYHWHVTGPRSRNLYELFNEQYHELDRWIGRLGERARVLGIVAQTGWSDLIRAPRISPARGRDLSAACMMAELISLHDQTAERLRADAAACAERHGDAASAELLHGLIEYHESIAWMLGELLEDQALARA
jgi:starvation-inducible DNA-binding protein